MSASVQPFTAVIATRNRPVALRNMLESLAKQTVQPNLIIIVDGSDDGLTKDNNDNLSLNGLLSKIKWIKATELGAAAQRNQGCTHVSDEIIGFFDDDILFEDRCVERMWKSMIESPDVGGVSALILNQQFSAPGFATRFVLGILGTQRTTDLAGRVVGPAVNFLPASSEDMNVLNHVDWLNTTCVLYRKCALPTPVFPNQFKGYSLMEDLALSLTVGKRWTLLNNASAKIIHLSQPGDHKSNIMAISKMALINRLYIMREILDQHSRRDYLNLMIWEAFQCFGILRQNGVSAFALHVKGKISGVMQLLR